MLAPLRLEDVVVESLNLRTSSGSTGAGDDPDEIELEYEEPTPHIDVDFEILRAGDEPRFAIPLTIRLNHRRQDFESSGYALDMRVIGFFSFRADVTDKQISQLIGLNAPSILYGVARGIAAQVFGVTRYNRVYLPSVNFLEVASKRNARVRHRRTRAKDTPSGPEQVPGAVT